MSTIGAVALTCVLELACAAIVVCAILRPRLHKDRGHALAFLPPAGLLALAATWVVVWAGAPASAPLWCGAGLCVLAAWCFLPTRRTRFREFERAFWAYVLSAHEDSPVGDW